MIAFALLLQAAAAPVPLDTIPRQQLPARGCAAYLWTNAEPHRLVAMARSEAADLTLSFAGHEVTLTRAESSGDAGFGFGSTVRYTAAGATVTLDIAVATQPSLTAGGTVSQATLTIDRPGQDLLIVPVAGLVGCVPS